MTPPTPADLKARYPEFAAIDDARVQYWLTDAERTVTTDWSEADYAVGLMTLAAHEMVTNGEVGAGDQVSGLLAKGITDFRSASFSASFDASVAQRAAAGGYSSTRYGQAFAVLLRRNTAGPRLVGCAWPC
ncbi:DUF4054 domain-containing protein [Sphingomonas sp. Leaf10]|uniref:DUF4054 domain-containing protein n=1 Tax=Sphingomonas sp. Leaf10 TaxID=1735676 RepID=UPI0006FEDEAA|nr:DUF4054 domain-containing protein [Sphingomonas sp. Leaf10]KQM37940.1 hypothetical protein ASE59_11615 [Sphingomonas sp. Leaf10]